MAESFKLNVTAESFKKLAVPAYVSTIENNSREIYRNILIKDDGKDINAFGTNGYMCYKTIVMWDKGKDEISDGFRACLNADQVINVAKRLNRNSSVSIEYDEGASMALCTITTPNSTCETTYFTIFEESRGNHFPDDILERLFIASRTSDNIQDCKTFNFVLLEKMCKHIKTAIQSQRDRKTLHINQYRSGLKEAEVFEYQWFSALIMPIKQ